MKLDRKITLVRPGTVTRGPDGTALEGPPVRVVRSAARRATTGSDQTPADTAVLRLAVVYTLRYAGLAALDSTWWIEDDGMEYRIESVKESPIGRRQFLLVEAVARE